ncbi:phosphotransferase [Phytoactinopolyspora halotolerans]|uniref:Phosphotransferase n=2 Tax=Phytoactinopolyspora halotolerans TaxID=1981512 RepID=A0A6L9SC32_9ACTN|nr:phosphotransferase [Phytoactinopolyspora halotolerans]
MSTHDLVRRMGRLFAIFDERSQDSGHVSYGVDTGSARYFVKTAGGPAPSAAGTSRDERVSVLRRAAEIHHIDHPALVALHDVITTSDGIAVVYDWFDGELLHCPRERRQNPAEAHHRFKTLPAEIIASAVDEVIDLHVALESAGWVNGDFYDGCLMYDFRSGDIRVIDFECYRQGPYLNDKGRLPGSTRFMAPEEFELGATIDSRTSVFNLARMVEIFYLAEHESPAARARRVGHRPLAG